MRHAQPRWTRFLALAALLGTAACTSHYGEEPLYVLRDSMGRSVAMAGASQLGGAAPGTTLRANVGGVEQTVMVGERVGMGPAMAPRQAAASPMEMAAATAPAEPLPPVAEVPLLSGVTSTPLSPPDAAPQAGSTTTGSTTTRRAQQVAAGETPTGRRRGPPPRSVSRSVM
ncbi:polyadenylate binding domain-containing protein [Sediminicoccus rosea]|uniref:Uncharacterized protein n=1 Tax=Sediminicoccus rosea TaxID=1225128 RepID=A0ABZ0PD54_9PROT|nr:hypothetical protein [Sediminicoccus rosea]WPB83367.1 hypothetical protein R9Z33_14790 [Sediminicoccus rosea]